MTIHCSGRRTALWLATTNKGAARSAIADLGKRITRLQSRYNLPAYRVVVLETRGGLHAHMVFIGTGDIAGHLQKSSVFAGLIDVRPVTDAGGLVRKYLSKERTPQAGYRREHMLGGRLKGSHRLEGGGDRVRLSRELERDAIEGGYVEPWRHSNARRSPERKTYRRRALITRSAPRPAGQISLPDIDRPVSRLYQFGGGYMPPSVALEVEHLRNRYGLTQRELAARIGVSQGQYANALRGHDPLSAFAVNRLRETLGANTDKHRVNHETRC
jgi:hypothetical protein